MSDMGDMYRDLREHNREEKAKHDSAWLREADSLFGDSFVRLSPFHWRTTIAGFRFDYWPTTGAYRWSDKTQHGDPAFVHDLIGKLRHALERG